MSEEVRNERKCSNVRRVGGRGGGGGQEMQEGMRKMIGLRRRTGKIPVSKGLAARL